FRANYADHRLVASMIGNLTVYTALTQPGDIVMTIAQPFGGHSSNRMDGPAGVRGLKNVDVPMGPIEFGVDVGLFFEMAPFGQTKSRRTRREHDAVSLPVKRNDRGRCGMGRENFL